ncbi:Crp/Fnr family transcriptional regulator [Niabella ginsengisoli]|uniref:Crp/Fnr family transcriptional regulator n=1 Tax=Niabella ginsengisoli TaxID=522298 RepID=A0ABS9SIU1_9BACT|nr:Crp/Fnr family transcriptional regulator [Niabella ginsengisoli]MCH5598287.1 Crp/Fnr family transcriptional regulator [Niabella ginsengisoli]
MKDQKLYKLSENFLYQNCVPEWRSVIDDNREIFVFKKGETIFREGDQLKGVYFIGEGKVKIHQRWEVEKNVIVRFARNGDMIGYRGMGSKKKLTASATAIEASSLMFIPINIFETSLKVNPQLAYILMDLYINELESTERRIRNMAHMDVKGRIVEALLMLKECFGMDEQGFIDIKLTKQEIASYVGATYETVSRVTMELESKKYIKSKGKSIAILKLKSLRELLTL